MRRATLREVLGSRARRTGGSLNSSPPRQRGMAAAESLVGSRATVSESRTAGHEAVGHALQQEITHRVPERVVDALEVVEIEEHAARTRLSRLAPGQGLLQRLVEQDAVREPGEVVVVVQEPDAVLGLPARGDVLHGAGQTRRGPAGAGDRLSLEREGSRPCRRGGGPDAPVPARGPRRRPRRPTPRPRRGPPGGRARGTGSSESSLRRIPASPAGGAPRPTRRRYASRRRFRSCRGSRCAGRRRGWSGLAFSSSRILRARSMNCTRGAGGGARGSAWRRKSVAPARNASWTASSSSRPVSIRIGTSAPPGRLRKCAAGGAARRCRASGRRAPRGRGRTSGTGRSRRGRSRLPRPRGRRSPRISATTSRTSGSSSTTRARALRLRSQRGASGHLSLRDDPREDPGDPVMLGGDGFDEPARRRRGRPERTPGVPRTTPRGGARRPWPRWWLRARAGAPEAIAVSGRRRRLHLRDEPRGLRQEARDDPGEKAEAAGGDGAPGVRSPTGRRSARRAAPRFAPSQPRSMPPVTVCPHAPGTPPHASRRVAGSGPTPAEI